MLTIQDKQFVDLYGPEFKERGFLEELFYFFFIFCVQRYPGSLCFHTDGVMINSSFIDKVIDISAVGWHQAHELVVHFKLYGDLVFLHV